jgi:transcriptional regulator with XRE-family HTH domain
MGGRAVSDRVAIISLQALKGLSMCHLRSVIAHLFMAIRIGGERMAKRKVKIEQAEIVQRVAKRLRGLREARNLTRAQLADMASVGLSHLGRLERGKASPGVDLLDRLAKSLGVTVTDLLPPAETQETLPELLERAKQLLDKVDRETLLFLNPLLARLA